MQVDTSLKIINDSILFTDSSTTIGSSIIKNPESFITDLPKDDFLYSIKENNSHDWLTLLLLLGFVLLAISKFVFRKRFNDLFKAFWARNYSNQLMRDGNIFKEQFGLTMLLLYIVSIPIFYALSILFFFPNKGIELNLPLVIQIAALPILLWIYRFIFIKTTAFIFKTTKPSNEILTQLLIFNFLSGIVVLPFITLFYYSESSTFLIFGIVIWSIIQIYRFIRLFVLGFSYSIFSGLHLFLYLCTLEIVPIVILIKIVSNFYQ